MGSSPKGGIYGLRQRSLAASQPRSLAASAILLILFAAPSALRAQVLPNPDLLIPFAPETYNGPQSGTRGIFAFGSFNLNPANAGVSVNVFDGNTGTRVPFPATFPTGAVPYTVGPPNAPTLARMRLHNGLGPLGVDPAEDDNPQGLGGGPGGRVMHHRRHRLVPTNQEMTFWRAPYDTGTDRVLVSTVVKVNSDASLGVPQQGGVVTIDYLADLALAPAIVSSVWPTVPTALAVGGGLGGGNAVAYTPAPASFQVNVLSDLAPNVFPPGTPTPSGLAWVTGTQTTGDTPAAPAPPGLLVIANYSGAGPPVVTTELLQSPFSPYAEKLRVWNNLTGAPGLQVQYVLVPCRDGVEVYDPTLVGTGTALVKVVATAPGKEICSNISFFGPSPYDDTPPTAYFIVLERDIGEMQPAGGGVNFIVFDLLTGSVAARGPVGAASTLPGLTSTYSRGALDVVRGCNDIAVAPPERNAQGESNPSPSYAATAWFGVWDANTAVQATPATPASVFGGLVGVENWGLASYSDANFGFNAAGPFPSGTNVRYFSPARDTSGALFTSTLLGTQDLSYPIPVGEVSTNPIFNPLPGQGIVNQNLITWYWENGLFGSLDPFLVRGTGYGVGVLSVAATWRTTNPAFPGGLTVDGSGQGSYPNYVDRSHETITERPLFGYVNYPSAAIVFAQRQCGIETLGATLVPSTPRAIYAMGRFPQTPAPTTPPSVVQWTYQKRRHSAWNPPPLLHPVVNPPSSSLDFPFTFGLDTAITIESTEIWDAVTNPQPRNDDWVSYFVNWRWSVMFGIFPFAQGATYWDWASPRAGQNLLPLGAGDATTSPPPTQRDNGTGPILGSPFVTVAGQTPLWADWNLTGSPFYLTPQYRPVLRSHSNSFPISLPADNNAWVGIGGQQMIKYSYGANALPSSLGPWPVGGIYGTSGLGAPGRPSIIAMHIDQVDPAAPTSQAGLPPAAGGPGQFRVNFLHIQADPAAGAGPGFEATYVNNPFIPDWQQLLPIGEIVSTEIATFDL